MRLIGGSRGRRAAALPVVVVLWLMTAGVGEARAQLCGLPLLPACPKAPSTPPPPPCQLGKVDENPADAPIAPATGQRLLPRRPDGRLPWGFAESSFGRSVGAGTAQRLYRKAGATLSRLVLDWGAIEREPGGRMYWEHTDHSYCAAIQAGVRPIMTLATVPRWALEPGTVCLSLALGCRNPPRPAAYPALRRFAEAAAIRYPQAAAVEAWNEPNADAFWYRPDVERYVDVLREIYTGVKNGRPSTVVLGGALANHQSDLPLTGSIGIYTFLEGMYELGAAELMDGLSFHPYPVNPLGHPHEYFTRTVDGVRAIVERHEGAGTRRLWLTELGAVQGAATGGSAGYSGAGQAAVLSGIYDRANAMPDVDAITYYTLGDTAGQPPWGWVTRGLFGRLMPRQVFCTFAARFAAPINCNAPV